MKIPPLFYVCALLCLWSSFVLAEDVQNISLVFVSQEVEHPAVLSNLLEDPDDLGVQGARLALSDNNTTGRFLKQKFSMAEVRLKREADVLASVKEYIAKGDHLFILDLDDTVLRKVLAGVESRDVLFFNSRAPDNHFRQEACDYRLLHTMPSRAMLGDALAQYLVKKRWVKWFLISGETERDVRFSQALKRAAAKFGAKIITEKTWDGARDARRTAQAEVPLLTQGKDYDVMMVADELGDFGEFLMYRTFDPRPVAGTQGLFPTAWFWTQEQWGASQLQKRFKGLAGRFMQARDYSAWVAVRTIGEAATRTGSNTFSKINDYIRSDAFELGAFKGRKLSYRHWNGQLRQPIALSAARSLVAQAPLEGFLHQRTELDTLGFDLAESKCKEFIK